eukprot:TRINITY_DN14970_c0_g1_i1.p1 TRINITY_DN14970_c0_g1~~TRINITY_DN14970_c0_g1_i1.p1  ORF type:complete len:460 (-),score=93.78 TRINITY_DN14970_c0_g1_i1:43-1422(-)
MTRSFAVCIVLIAAVTFATAFRSDLTREAASDQITSLPGLSDPIGFRQYAGYLDVDATHGRRIFYWFVEAQSNPTTAPVVWWSNGGPGCSGLIGMFTEHGPWRVNPDGKTLSLNPYSWNLVANMLYVEAPAGVGFSYSNNTSDYTVGDARTAADNYQSLVSFFAKFPQFAKNAFWLSSESYGGHYAPQLAAAVVAGNAQGKNPHINLKGFAVGNPLTDMISNNLFGGYPTWWSHALISDVTWKGIQQNCIERNNKIPCDAALHQADVDLADIDPYGIYFPTCNSGMLEQRRIVSYIRPQLAQPPATNSYDPCLSTYMQQYLRQNNVVQAIHAEVHHGAWSECSSVVNYSDADVQAPVEAVYQQLLGKDALKIVVFSGDVDTICPYLGSQHWIGALDLPIARNWTHWMVDGQVAGFSTVYSPPTGSFAFVTVRGAGHMVSQYKPELGLEFFKRFLDGVWF